MIKFFITRILKWAASLTWAQFISILPEIANAITLYPKTEGASNEINAAVNRNRAAYVSNVIMRSLKVPESVANLIREIALLWVRRSK